MAKQKSILIPMDCLGLFFVFLFTPPDLVYAQSDHHTFFWINAGVGAGSVGEEGGECALERHLSIRSEHAHNADRRLRRTVREKSQ